MAGLRPYDIWECELWEYNACIAAYLDRNKRETATAIITGYYCAYYTNGGKKAKKPDELIKKMYTPTLPKQSFEDGLQAIERIKAIDKAKQ